MNVDRELIKDFDSLMDPVRPYCYRDSLTTYSPTEKSINEIEDHFRIRLPESLIEFCLASINYDSWFTSVGENYQSFNHIIRANSHYKKIRRRVGGVWKYKKPSNFLVINAGSHDKCLCIDTNKYCKVSGEFGLQYWLSGYESEFGDAYINFPAYIQSLVTHLKGSRCPS